VKIRKPELLLTIVLSLSAVLKGNVGADLTA